MKCTWKGERVGDGRIRRRIIIGTGEMGMWSLMAVRSVHLVFCCRDKIIIVGSQLVGCVV